MLISSIANRFPRHTRVNTNLHAQRDREIEKYITQTRRGGGGDT